MRRPRLSLAVLFAIAAVACRASMTGGRISVEPSSTAQHLVFRLDPSVFLYGLSVETCDGARVQWAVGRAGGDPKPPATVVYGEAPPGYTTQTGPRPLTPDCYRVVISGPESARFRVERDGGVTVLTGRRRR
jgi:hypothetical protein